MVVLERTPDGPYSSQGDERAFWEWVNRIPGVVRVWGSGPTLYIELRRRRISNESLRELLALFKRYGVSMSQLAQFESASNMAWFRDPRASWYRAVFKGEKASKRPAKSPGISAPRKGRNK